MAPRRAAVGRRHGAARASGAPTRLGRRKSQLDHHLSAAARRRGDRRSSSPPCSNSRFSLADEREALLERAGGNPLFARAVRPHAHRARERPKSCRSPCRASSPRGSTRFPRAEKDFMHEAAVHGKVFWLGGVSSTGGIHTDEAERVARALARKEFVRRERALLGRRRYAIRVRARTHPRRHLRPDPRRERGGEASPGGGVARGARPRRGPRRAARLPLQAGHRARTSDRERRRPAPARPRRRRR